MEIHRRNSLLRRNSLISIQNGVADSDLDFLQPQPDDDAFFKEMDMISSLGNSSLSDQEMVDILNKIIQ